MVYGLTYIIPVFFNFPISMYNDYTYIIIHVCFEFFIDMSCYSLLYPCNFDSGLHYYSI